MIITAPETLRAQLPDSGLPNKVIDACLRLRPDTAQLDDPTQATKPALRTIAVRAKGLREEIRVLDRQLAQLVADVAPATMGTFAMGVDTTSALLVAIGDNPDRLRSEAAFAHLCGVAPIPASLGKTNRHRLQLGAIAPAIGHCTSPRSSACVIAHAPAPTLSDELPRACQSQRSSAA